MKMDNRLNYILSDGDVIYQDGSRKIIIDQAMELGGSAVVYKASIICENDTKSVLVKEIFPAGCNLERAAADMFVSKKGQLFAYSDDKKLRNEYASKYMKFIQLSQKEVSSQRMVALNDDGFRSDYFFSPSEFIPADKSQNGNCYLILDTTAGDCLKDLIGKKADNENATHTLCGYLSTALSALEIMHKKGIRHLDVAPDNIFVSDTGIARLIDYNSASSAEDDGVFRVSYKKGFSAPEVKYLFLSPEKVAPNDVLNDTVDLYSVAAVLYAMVYGTTFEYGEHAEIDSEISRRHLEKKLGQELPFITPRASAQLKRILRKGLAVRAKDRYQTAKEMRSDIEELKKLTSPEEKYLIGTKHLTYPDNCIPRDEMLQKMSSTIHEGVNHCVIVSGVGGCGKSELAVMYALEHKDEYDTVCVASYMEANEDSSNSVIKDTNTEKIDDRVGNMICSMKFHGIDMSQYEKQDSGIITVDIDRMYRDKSEKLSEEGNRTLLIIEDYTANISGSLNTLLQIAPNCHIIINTREVFSSPFLLPVEDITDDEAYRFFCQTSGRTDDESADIRSIINVVNKHILLMKLLALHLQNFGRVTAAVLLEKLTSGKTLEEGEFEYSSTRNGVTDISAQATIDAHLAKVLSLSALSEHQCLILSAMTIVPYSGMAQTDFENAMKLGLTDNTVNVLIKYGWITKKNGVISLHQAVSDYLYRAEKTRPDWERLDDFIGSGEMLNLIEYDEEMAKEQKEATIDNSDFFYKRIKGETRGCAITYVTLGLSYATSEHNPYKAYTAACKGLNLMISKRFNITYIWLYKGYYAQAISSYLLQQYEKSLQHFQSLLKINIIPNNSREHEQCLFWTAMSLYHLKKYHDAINYLTYSLNICKKLDGELGVITINRHAWLGRILFASMQYDEAIIHFKHAIAQCYPRERFHTNCYWLAMSQFRAEKYDNAIVNLEYSLWMCEDIYGKSHKYTENEIYWLAMSYYKSKQYKKALVFFQQSLDICKKIYGIESYDTANVYQYIADTYEMLGNTTASNECATEASRIIMILQQNNYITCELLDSLAEQDFYSDWKHSCPCLPRLPR